MACLISSILQCRTCPQRQFPARNISQKYSANLRYVIIFEAPGAPRLLKLRLYRDRTGAGLIVPFESNVSSHLTQSKGQNALNHKISSDFSHYFR